MSDDDKLFAEEMAGGKPLQKPARVALKKAAVDAPSFAARREAAQAKPGVKTTMCRC